MLPAVLASSALGLLTGYLIGLSASPVVAAVISALLAMVAGVAALAGAGAKLVGKPAGGEARDPRHDMAAFAFALLTIVGVTGGTWVRTHNLLSPDPAAVQATWQALGFDDDTAARIALARLTGISVVQEGSPDLQVPDDRTGGTILFSTGEVDACQRTDPRRAPSADEARQTWRLAPGDWPAFAEAMSAADLRALNLFWSTVCEGGR